VVRTYGSCLISAFKTYSHKPGVKLLTRLSDILLLSACYLSSISGENTIYLNEDRNNVLVNNRMSGQRRWDLTMKATTSPELWLLRTLI
jgi:hypothetical protein